MAELVCVACGRAGTRREQWYEGSSREVELDPDEAVIEHGVFICADCYRSIDPEDRARWKPVTSTTGSVQERTGG